ncbi:MAG: chemotaxis protein CheR [Desulfuromonadaceae bacterium]|nr:chemotaxis protein CheR [Desulfuromonadaceae bacterium]
MAFSFFMRDLPTLEHAANHMIPHASGRSRIKIWDAGSAMGQETYSVAMVLAERMNAFAFRNLTIDATDYDQANKFGDHLTNAVYHKDELQRTPVELVEKYFEPAEKPGHLQVKPHLRDRIRFRYHDLLSLQPVGQEYSLILCKNVLLHFQPEQRIEVLKMFHQALTPGGFFACENTQKMPQELSGKFEQVVPDSHVFRKV